MKQHWNLISGDLDHCSSSNLDWVGSVPLERDSVFILHADYKESQEWSSHLYKYLTVMLCADVE